MVWLFSWVHLLGLFCDGVVIEWGYVPMISIRADVRCFVANLHFILSLGNSFHFVTINFLSGL